MSVTSAKLQYRTFMASEIASTLKNSVLSKATICSNFSFLSPECVTRTLAYLKEPMPQEKGALSLSSPIKHNINFLRGLIPPLSSKAHVRKVKTFWVLGKQILEIQMLGLYLSLTSYVTLGMSLNSCELQLPDLKNGNTWRYSHSAD